MNLILRPWRHYADFNGRSSRTEFFLFFIIFYGFLIPLVVFGLALGSIGSGEGEGPGLVFLGIFFIWFLAGIIPSWAVTIRRLHDQDKSGWFILLTFIPYLGFLFWLLFAFWPGTEGENDYGWNPRDGNDPTESLEQVFS